MPVADYFDYEKRVAEQHLIGWLRARAALPRRGHVLDVGCGYGGTLAALRDAEPQLKLTGLDIDRQMIEKGKQRVSASIELTNENFFAFTGARYDLILLRDVLEHIETPEAALARAATLLAPGGRLFVSFAPFLGPFGGHQHNGAGPFSRMPWVQALPARVFRALVPVVGNSYKEQRELHDDMESVLRTRLTTRRFLRGARRARLRVITRTSYLSRPDYRIKHGLITVPLPRLFGAEECLTTGVEALLGHASET